MFLREKKTISEYFNLISRCKIAKYIILQMWLEQLCDKDDVKKSWNMRDIINTINFHIKKPSFKYLVILAPRPGRVSSNVQSTSSTEVCMELSENILPLTDKRARQNRASSTSCPPISSAVYRK